MKKMIKKLALLPLFCGLLLTSACSNDDDNNNGNKLVGTTWVMPSFILQGWPPQSVPHSVVVRFISETEFEHWRENATTGVRLQTFDNGTYSLNCPNIRMLNDNWVFSSSTRFHRTSWSPGGSEQNNAFTRR